MSRFTKCAIRRFAQIAGCAALLMGLANPSYTEEDNDRTVFRTDVSQKFFETTSKDAETSQWLEKFLRATRIRYVPGSDWKREEEARQVKIVAVRVREGRPVDGVISNAEELKPESGALPLKAAVSTEFRQTMNSWFPGDQWFPGSDWIPGTDWIPGSDWSPGDQWIPRGEASEVEDAGENMILVYAIFENTELTDRTALRPVGVELKAKSEE